MKNAVSIPPSGRFHALGRNVLLKNIAETSRLFQMAFFVVVARQFGPAVLGEVTVLLMVGSVVGLVFGDLGINLTMIARMCAETVSARERIASTGLFWKVVLSGVSFVLMVVAMRLTIRSGTWTEILAVAVISCGAIWHEFVAALTNGVNRLDIEAWFRPAYRAAVYGGGALMCLFAGLSWALACMASAAFVMLALGLAFIRARVVQFAVSRPDAGLMRESFPMWITQVSQLTYLKLDLVILGLLHVAARETGWYAAAWKIVDVLTTVPALLAAAALPLISGATPETDASAIAPGYLKAMYVLPFLFVLPVAIGAEWISEILYGSGFAAAADVLRILVWALVPICVHSFLANLAVATRRQGAAAKAGAVTATLGVLAALLCVPRFGYQSMALISLVVNSLFAVAMVVRFRDVTGSIHLALGFKSLTSALAIFGASFLFAKSIPPILLMIGGLVAYNIALLALGAITLRDLSRGWRLAGTLLWNRPVERVGAA
jgi:O-antigen/teichoic acid export membrane protein